MGASLSADLRAALDPGLLLAAAGLLPDPWQEDVLRSRPLRALLCCSRQAGKTVTAAAASVHEALYTAGSLILMLAPSQRQSSELLRVARMLLNALAPPVLFTSEGQQLLELKNGSRIISLPAREDTIRGYSKVALVVFDEAAWVEDELYMAVRPMLAVSGGRLLALSTPNGQRGWFHQAWTSPEAWKRVRITAAQCPRIPREFLEEERRSMTASRFASEYECEFADAIDSVFSYADVLATVDAKLTPLFSGAW